VNFTFSQPAVNDWVCHATNATAGTALAQSNTGAYAPGVNIQVNGSSGDLIRFSCTAF